MRHSWALIALLVLAVGCTAYEAPQQVQDAAEHQLADFVQAEAELMVLIPADAELEYTTITGATKTGNARTLWRARLRSFMFRGAGLLAWSRGEPYDPAAAFAKLFPDRVDAPAPPAPPTPGDPE